MTVVAALDEARAGPLGALSYEEELAHKKAYVQARFGPLLQAQATGGAFDVCAPPPTGFRYRTAISVA